jgi:hypothetical protein
MVNYPIIRLDRDQFGVASYADERAASVATPLTIKKRIFENGLYFDSQGKEFKVSAQLPPSAKGPIGWVRTVISPFMLAKLTFTETGALITLEDLRRRVLDQIERDKDLYRSSGTLGRVRGQVLRSKTYHELISCFLGL